MRFLIITDLEGVAGIDSFSQTRTQDLSVKAPGMKQLAREASACARGIMNVLPNAMVDIWDGHGGGAIDQSELTCGTYIGHHNQPYWDMSSYDGLLFVGQHAMVGSINAPLCHTYSSLNVAYYRLNGVYMGEFSCLALIAGLQGVPAIFLSGDDKACLEACMFVPNIETVAVKKGLGVETAIHMNNNEACVAIAAGAARAVRRIAKIAPFNCIKPPFVFEVRNNNPVDKGALTKRGYTIIDERTYQIKTDDIRQLPF